MNMCRIEQTRKKPSEVGQKLPNWDNLNVGHWQELHGRERQTRGERILRG